MFGIDFCKRWCLALSITNVGYRLCVEIILDMGIYVSGEMIIIFG